jgi:peptidylprolyl isomerase
MKPKAILLALAATLSLGQASAFAQATPGWRAPDPQNVLVIDTNKGRIIAELTPNVAPLNAARVKELTRAGFYNGRAFFRVVDGFMAQTGDPTDTGTGGSELPDLPPEFSFKRGAETPLVPAPAGNARGGFIGPMVVTTQSNALMALMADGRVSAQARFCKGVLGMARAATPDSANSQFFLMRDTRPDLDGKYTPFGRVLVGLDVVRALKVGEPVAAPQDRITTARLLADIPAAERPRVLVRDTATPEFAGVIQAKGAKFDACDLDIEAVVQ